MSSEQGSSGPGSASNLGNHSQNAPTAAGLRNAIFSHDPSSGDTRNEIDEEEKHDNDNDAVRDKLFAPEPTGAAQEGRVRKSSAQFTSFDPAVKGDIEVEIQKLERDKLSLVSPRGSISK